MKKQTKSQIIAKLKRLEEGETLKVNLLPSKSHMSGFKMRIQPYEVELQKSDLENKYAGNNDLTYFESIVNNFAYYNCTNETGNRVHYYIKEQ